MLQSILGQIVAAIIGKIMEYFRQKQLEDKAAKADALERYINGAEEAGRAEGEVARKIEEAQAAHQELATAKEKLERIRAWNEKMKNWGKP